MKVIVFVALVCALAPAPSFAWDGTNSETGEPVEIGKGNLVRSGEEIEIYDYGTGDYRQVIVDSISSGISAVELEVYDSDTGEFLFLEMERD